jgi:hypothetical protein
MFKAEGEDKVRGERQRHKNPSVNGGELPVRKIQPNTPGISP